MSSFSCMRTPHAHGACIVLDHGPCAMQHSNCYITKQIHLVTNPHLETTPKRLIDALTFSATTADLWDYSFKTVSKPNIKLTQKPSIKILIKL